MQRTVSAVLHCDIQAYANELGERSELMQRARSGRLSGATVLRYLAGLRFLTQQTTRLLGKAADVAERREEHELARHFRGKLVEETGHHLWAESDMRGVSQAFGGLRAPESSVALQALVTYLEGEIARAPVNYLAYALLVELVTIAVGPAWLTALEQNCGISGQNLSVVHNHVLLDREHVREGLAEIDALAKPEALAGMREAIREAIVYFDAFASELLVMGEAA
jgi:hypothetical protein